MNRSERRKNKIIQKDPVLCIKRSDFDKKCLEMYQKGIEDSKDMLTQDIVTDVFTCLLGLPLKVLKDHYGWGHRKRLPEFADIVISEFDRLDLGKKSLDEVREFIFEESGIKFETYDK